jgi:hypothetical protein
MEVRALLPRYSVLSMLFVLLRSANLLFNHRQSRSISSHRHLSRPFSFAMSDFEDSLHLSRSSSPLGLRQDVPRDPSSPGLSPTPPTPIPSTLTECPMKEWIQLHPCWLSNTSFTRTEETAGASSWDNSYLASLVPIVGYVFEDMTFLQYLGLLSDLRERQSCDMCQKIYQYIVTESIEKKDKDNNTNVGENENEISCSIYYEDDGRSCFRILVSKSYHFCTVISDATTLMHRLPRGKADIVMRRIRGHDISNCHPYFGRPLDTM